jgi:hypothetical protein
LSSILTAVSTVSSIGRRKRCALPGWLCYRCEWTGGSFGKALLKRTPYPTESTQCDAVNHTISGSSDHLSLNQKKINSLIHKQKILQSLKLWIAVALKARLVLQIQCHSHSRMNINI